MLSCGLCRSRMTTWTALVTLPQLARSALTYRWPQSQLCMGTASPACSLATCLFCLVVGLRHCKTNSLARGNEQPVVCAGQQVQLAGRASSGEGLVCTAQHYRGAGIASAAWRSLLSALDRIVSAAWCRLTHVCTGLRAQAGSSCMQLSLVVACRRTMAKTRHSASQM